MKIRNVVMARKIYIYKASDNSVGQIEHSNKSCPYKDVNKYLSLLQSWNTAPLMRNG